MRPLAWKIVKPAAGSALASNVAKSAASLKRRRKSILVDGNNVLYHFYDPLCSIERDGNKAGAIDGLVRLLRRLDDKHQPQHVAVFFDKPKQTTMRKLIDPKYKSNRRPTPSALRPQLTSVLSLLEAANVKCISCDGIEADDLIASYTTALHTNGYDVLIVSNDNDFLQLARGEPTPNKSAAQTSDDSESASQELSSCVEIYQMNKRRYLRERHIRGRFTVAPWQLPDFFSLCGLNWGKLPRVAGVTDELAVELLTKYGTLHHLLRNLDEIEDPELRKTLKQSISSIETSYRISKLVDGYALPFAVEDLATPALELLPHPGQHPE